MRTLPLILIVSACAGTPCVRDYASVEPAHECLALNCADADSVEEWTEEVTDPETGGTTKTNYATCPWGWPVASGPGSRRTTRACKDPMSAWCSSARPSTRGAPTVTESASSPGRANRGQGQGAVYSTPASECASTPSERSTCTAHVVNRSASVAVGKS
jgi:hypothetical protein